MARPPRLSGLALKNLARFGRTRIGGIALQRILRSDLGIDKLDALPDSLRDDVPLDNALGYAIEVLMAEHVTVDAGAGQNDLAVVRDSPRKDDLIALGDTATLRWVNGALTGGVKRFNKVRAISVSGGGDTVNEQAHNYVLELLGDWQRI